MTLDYRMPDTGEHRVLRVMAELRSEEAIDWMLTLVKLAVGVPLTLVPPFVVTMYLFWWLLTHSRMPFLVVSVVVMALLMWLERRKEQNYLWEAVNEPYSMWILDLFLIGPRFLWSVYDQLHRRPVDQETLALAARVTVELLDQNHAIEVRELLTSDQSAPELSRALQYLERRHWVIISRGRSRVWLATSVRKQFAVLK